MRKKTAVFCIILMILLLAAGVVSAEGGFTILGRDVIPVGACFDFSADAQGEVTWTSSDASVAEVSETGRVTGISAGSCTIFADDGDVVEGFDGARGEQCKFVLRVIVALGGMLAKVLDEMRHLRIECACE